MMTITLGFAGAAEAPADVEAAIRARAHAGTRRERPGSLGTIAMATPDGSEGPARAVVAADVEVVERAVLGPHRLGVPGDLSARVEGDVAEEHRLGQGRRVAELGAGRTAGLARGDPFLVVAGRAGQGRLGSWEVGELPLGQELE